MFYSFWGRMETSLNCLDISKEQSNDVIKMLETLEEDDDVQNTFVNCNLLTE